MMNAHHDNRLKKLLKREGEPELKKGDLLLITSMAHWIWSKDNDKPDSFVEGHLAKVDLIYLVPDQKEGGDFIRCVLKFDDHFRSSMNQFEYYLCQDMRRAYLQKEKLTHDS